MSAPDMNAASPAPVATTTRTSPSAFRAVSTPGSAARICAVRALRRAGLLKVTVATEPATSTSSWSVPVSWFRIAMQQPFWNALDHRVGAQLFDLRRRVAQLGEDIVGVVARIGGRGPDGARRAGHPPRVADEVARAASRMG